MEKLIAIFAIELPEVILVKRADDDQHQFQFTIGEYEVSIELIVYQTNRSLLKKGEKQWIYNVREISVSVAKAEHELPPELIATESGNTDLPVPLSYFSQRREKYEVVALEALNRFIRFFKYMLQQPLLEELQLLNLPNPDWADEMGKEIRGDAKGYRVPSTPGQVLPRSKPLTADIELQLLDALKNPTAPKLYQEILSDAQSALARRNLRRAIVEMVTACEILIKQGYFSKSTRAGVAVQRLIDKRSINLDIFDLIHETANLAFSKSFHDDKNADYIKIKELVNCRNRVIHAGEISYRDLKGKLKNADYRKVVEWWKSVNTLVDWWEALPI